MDSMYGSHAGVSFVLSNAFSSYENMVKAFKQGPTYKTVWYGQYAILDTPNKNDADNGKIYRRGLDYSNANGGAEYIGQIVGPSSGTPYFQMTGIAEVEAKGTEVLEENSYRKLPLRNEDGTYKIVDEGKPELFEYKAETQDIVPGKYIVEEDGNPVVKYNDSIQYTWVNIRKDNADADSYFYVGWKFPYTVIDYTFHQVSPYNEAGNILKDATEGELVPQKDKDGNIVVHPYYELWDVGVPGGVKGDSLRNLRVITAGEEKPLENEKTNGISYYDIDAIQLDKKTNKVTFDESKKIKTTEDDDFVNKRQILVYDYYAYDSEQNPIRKVIRLGDYNMIKDITVDDEGSVIIDYTHDDKKTIDNKIKWIQSISLASDVGSKGGKLTVNYNNKTEPSVFDITWPKDIDIDKEGTVTYTYSGTEHGETGIVKDSKLLSWIKDVNLSTGPGPNGGELTFTFNNDKINGFNGNTKKTFNLTWVKDLIVKDNGKIVYTYSGPKAGAGNSGEIESENAIKWIQSLELTPKNGIFNIVYNTVKSVDQGDGTYKDVNESYTKQLDWVKDIQFDENSGTITIFRTTDETEKGNPLSARLKLLEGISVSDDGKITATFNTKDTFEFKEVGNDGKPTEKSYQLKTIKDVSLSKDDVSTIEDDKQITVTYNTNSTSSIGSPINYIQDMRVRPDDFHLLVLFNDKTHRASYDDETKTVKPPENSGTTAADWVSQASVKETFGDSVPEYRSTVYWRDYGTIKDQAGILVGMQLEAQTVIDAGYKTVPTDENPSKSDVIRYLNKIYGTGLTSGKTKEKVVVYAPSVTNDNANKEFYAFDYNKKLDADGKPVLDEEGNECLKGWFYVGTIADTGTRDVVLGDEGISNYENNLNSEGLYFITTSQTISTNGIPNYWKPNFNWTTGKEEQSEGA